MTPKKNVIIVSLIILGLISLSAAILSYYRLDRIPYGFHVDELCGAVNIGCMTTEGVDAHNIPHPLFAITGYGTPKPPTYIYIGVLWSKIFGYSVASLRAFSVTAHLAGIIGLFFLARSLFGWRYAFMTMTVASLSPWVWSMSRVAFESLFAATFMIWGIYLILKPPRIWAVLGAGLLFAAAIYSYPPFRLETPLMIITLLIYNHRKNPWDLRSWMLFIAATTLPIIPLIQKTISGEIQKRFNSISILSKDYLNSIHSQGSLKDIVEIFINNYLMHFKWDFLFLTGDPSFVHSTRHFGILSLMDTAALLIAVIWVLMLPIKKYRKNNPLNHQKTFLFFLMTNILIGVIPAALTNSELPNSLRITGAWPFMCLFSGYILWQACERWWGLWILTCALSIIFTIAYFNIYFKVYPQEAKGMFSYWTLEDANGLKTDQDWFNFVLWYRYQDYNARYFLMQYHGLSCTSSRTTWEGMRDFLMKQGKYY